MQNHFVILNSYLIPLLPLIGAIIAGAFGKKFLRGWSHLPIWAGVGVSAFMAISLLIAMISHEGNHSAESTTPAAHAEVASGEAAAGEAKPEMIGVPSILYTWIHAGSFKVDAGFWFDPLTAIMLCVVCCIGLLITIFAAGYMKGEEGYWRFFAYLGLFIFMMTCLVMGENLIMLYLGWEGVGLCSYLLIGYYYETPIAREAAKKAFIVNRIGDFGFALGIMLTFVAFGTVSYFGTGIGSHTGFVEMATGSISAMTPIQQTAMKWVPFLLMLGAFGKSAQFPLYVWLPDAMAGPTPVSALIHAATMVTAGIYMIVRTSPLFYASEAALTTIGIVGCFTAFFAGTIALRQFDLKKVFAYSTVSQLGFMFVGVAALAPVAGVFHLMTHAFFKALLFLCSGVVMHATFGELDLRKMSGLKKYLPKTNLLMLIGCAALAGFPFLTSGFYSKDEIIGNAWLHSKPLGAMMLLAAFMTAYYTFRLYFRVFQGPELIPQPTAGQGHGHGADDHGAGGHDDHAHHNHEPFIMMGPLFLLAIGAIFAGFLNFPSEKLGAFLGQSPSLVYGYEAAHKTFGESASPSGYGQEIKQSEEAEHAEHSAHTLMMVSSIIASLGGIALAYHFHLKNRQALASLEKPLGGVITVLEGKYWVDEIYDFLVVRPLRVAGRILWVVDRWIVDGVVNLASYVPQVTGFVLKLTTQRGYLQGYAAAMLFGIAVILLFVFMQ